MYTFDYHRPASVAEALKLVGANPENKFLAGGMTMLPTMKLRLASPHALVDLARVAELKSITVEPGTLVIGAMTTHANVARSREVARAIPALAQLAGRIGDPAVRHRGTIGGSIANADPAADYPAALLALGATVVTNGRQIRADDYFTGLFETALKPGELVMGVRFPLAAKAAYMKFPNPASRYAMVGVMVVRSGERVRLAVTGAGAFAFRVPAMESALTKNFSPSAIAAIRVPADGLNSDIHGDAAYRAHLIGVLARRAVEAAL
jgi:carbon-monoxide dehydrogenase medium subunit